MHNGSFVSEWLFHSTVICFHKSWGIPVRNEVAAENQIGLKPTHHELTVSLGALANQTSSWLVSLCVGFVRFGRRLRRTFEVLRCERSVAHSIDQSVY